MLQKDQIHHQQTENAAKSPNNDALVSRTRSHTSHHSRLMRTTMDHSFSQKLNYNQICHNEEIRENPSERKISLLAEGVGMNSASELIGKNA